MKYIILILENNSFSGAFETNFDPSLPKLKVVRQEIVRVVLNLINNAFFSVNQKARQNGDAYDPIVILTTKRLPDKIEIRVKDNGVGIPASIKEKIFQPFFTTKPTGQGTGLGLSLAYDIITKAHGGELKVDSEEGAGCELIILLPLSQNV